MMFTFSSVPKRASPDKILAEVCLKTIIVLKFKKWPGIGISTPIPVPLATPQTRLFKASLQLTFLVVDAFDP